jgi:hypothetical protein
MKPYLPLALLGVLAACTAASSKDADKAVEPTRHETASAPIPFGARVQLRSQDFVKITHVETRSRLRSEQDNRQGVSAKIFVLVEYVIKAPSVAPEALASFPTLCLVSPTGQVYASDPKLEAAYADDRGFVARSAEVLKLNGQILDVLVFEVPAASFQASTWQILTDNETHLALQ